MSTEASTPIPRFVVPDTYTTDHYRNYRAFRSPEDGEIVQILDDLWHASEIDDWMRADGERLTLADFQAVALDPLTYPKYDDRINSYDLRMNMAGAAFNAVLNPIIDDALAAGWALIKENPDAYQENVYGPYYSWARNAFRRRQFLVSTQRAFATYQALSLTKPHLKFLRTLEVLFDVELPDDEPMVSSEEPNEDE